MMGKTMLFEIILTTVSVVALYESWNYLNSANADNYSQIDLIGFPAIMISGMMFAIGSIYLIGDVTEFFKGKKGD